MALGVEIKEDTGLNLSYLRILEVDINFVEETTNIYLEKYIDGYYRDKAKEKEKIQKSIIDLRQQSESQSDKDLAISLHEKALSLEESNKELLSSDFSTGIECISLDYIPTDLSLSFLYNELTKLDKYSGAKEV